MALNLKYLLLSLPGLLVALSCHEFAHAWMADRMGDSTPRIYGRLRLEPWVHLDPLGTVLLVLYGFGWAKPVPVNPYNMRNPRRGILLVSLAGPLSNLVLAFVFLLSLRLGIGRLNVPYLTDVVRIAFGLNVGLAVFNLLPVPPLDGSKVLASILPYQASAWLHQLEQYGPILLVILLASNIINPLLGAVKGIVLSLLVWAVNAVTWFVP